MQITEIMVLNWISYKNHQYRIKNIINNDVVLESCIENEDDVMTDISNCSPIPLTRDILIELGFVELGGSFIFDSYSELTIVLKYDDNEESYKVTMGICNFNLHVQYVHELQNIIHSHKIQMEVDLQHSIGKYLAGDYVKVNGDVYEIMLRQQSDDGVINFHLHEYGRSEDDAFMKECGIDDIHPIAVGQTLLIMNGFIPYSKEHHSDIKIPERTELFMIKETDEASYKMLLRSGGKWEITNNKTSEYYEGYIQYVHQFQNICRNVVHITDFEFVPKQNEIETEKMMDSIYK